MSSEGLRRIVGLDCYNYKKTFCLYNIIHPYISIYSVCSRFATTTARRRLDLGEVS